MCVKKLSITKGIIQHGDFIFNNLIYYPKIGVMWVEWKYDFTINLQKWTRQKTWVRCGQNQPRIACTPPKYIYCCCPIMPFTPFICVYILHIYGDSPTFWETNPLLYNTVLWSRRTVKFHTHTYLCRYVWFNGSPIS